VSSGPLTSSTVNERKVFVEPPLLSPVTGAWMLDERTLQPASDLEVRPGDWVVAQVRAPGGLKGEFRIYGVAKHLQMVESQPGLYEGAYEIRPLDQADKARIRIFLEGSQGDLEADAPGRLTILQEPPRDKDPRMWRSWSPKVLVPLTTLQKYYRGDTKLNEIEVDTGDASTVAAAETRLRQVMTTLHRGEEDFQIQKLGEFMAERAREQRRAQAVFLAIGIVALLSGGIGIMNVSLATVYSRIREIGIRRAVGATRADVLGQFVTEATLLAVVGGMAGILAGLAGAWALPRFSQEIEVQLRWSSALLCLGISAVVGLVFSVYPAWQASRLDPVEALRYE